MKIELQFLHRFGNQPAVILLQPLLEFPVGHLDIERVAGHVAEARGSQPRLVALGVDLGFQVAKNLLPGVHDALRRERFVRRVAALNRRLCRRVPQSGNAAFAAWDRKIRRS